MRGLDTNLLLRYLTKDHAAQFVAASRTLEEAEERGQRFHVNVIVLCELVWTLKGPRYRFSRSEIAIALEKLVATPLFEIQARDLVVAALAEYRARVGDFADYLIGQLNLARGCDATLTFDTNLADSAAFAVLPS